MCSSICILFAVCGTFPKVAHAFAISPTSMSILNAADWKIFAPRTTMAGLSRMKCPDEHFFICHYNIAAYI